MPTTTKSKPIAGVETATGGCPFGIEELREVSGLAKAAWLRLRIIHRQQGDIASRIEVNENFRPDSIPGAADLEEIATLRDRLAGFKLQVQAGDGEMATQAAPPLDANAVECLNQLHAYSSALCINLVQRDRIGLASILLDDIGHFERAVRQLRSAIPPLRIADQDRWTFGDLKDNWLDAWRGFINPPGSINVPAFRRRLDLDRLPGVARIREFASRLDLREPAMPAPFPDPLMYHGYIIVANLDRRIRRAMEAQRNNLHDFDVEDVTLAEVARLIDSVDDLVCPQCEGFMEDLSEGRSRCEACIRKDEEPKKKLREASMEPLFFALRHERWHGRFDLNSFEDFDWKDFRAFGRRLFGDAKFDADPWVTLVDFARQKHECPEWLFLQVSRAEVIESLKVACEVEDRQGSPAPIQDATLRIPRIEVSIEEGSWFARVDSMKCPLEEPEGIIFQELIKADGDYRSYPWFKENFVQLESHPERIMPRLVAKLAMLHKENVAIIETDKKAGSRITKHWLVR